MESIARGDVGLLGDALNVLGRTAWWKGDTARAMAIAKENVELLEREPAGPPLAKAYAVLAARHALSGDAAESLAIAEKAVPLCRDFGLKPDVSRALQFRGWSRFMVGIDNGLEDNREAVRIALDADDTFASIALVNLAGLVWENEGPAPALEIYREAIAFAQRRGLSTGVSWAQAETTWMYYDLGRWDDLVEVADEVFAADPDRSQMTFLCLPYVAFTKVWRGRLDEAAASVDDILPRSREIHDPQILLPALEAVALVEWRRGDLGYADSLIDEYERETADRPMWRSLYLPTFVRILVAEGRVDVAERLAKGTAEYGARRGSCMASVRAILSEAKGQLEAATAQYQDAAERWAAFGHVLERGQALLGVGRCLLALGATSEATSRLREARDHFVQLRAQPLIEETDSLLERATALSS